MHLSQWYQQLNRFNQRIQKQDASPATTHWATESAPPSHDLTHWSNLLTTDYIFRQLGTVRQEARFKRAQDRPFILDLRARLRDGTSRLFYQ